MTNTAPGGGRMATGYGPENSPAAEDYDDNEDASVAVELLAALTSELGPQTGLRLHVTETATTRRNSRWRSPMPLPTMDWRRLALFRRAQWCSKQGLCDMERTRFIIPVVLANQMSLLLLRLQPAVVCTQYATRPDHHPVSHLRPMVQHFVELCHKRFDAWRRSIGAVPEVRTIDRVNCSTEPPALPEQAPGLRGASADSLVHGRLIAFMTAQGLLEASRRLVPASRPSDVDRQQAVRGQPSGGTSGGCVGGGGHDNDDNDEKKDNDGDDDGDDDDDKGGEGGEGGESGRAQGLRGGPGERRVDASVPSSGHAAVFPPPTIVFDDNLDWDDQVELQEGYVGAWDGERQVTTSRASGGP